VSGCAVVNYLLSNSAAVTALVAAARIVTGPVQLETTDTLPAVSIRMIDDSEFLTVPMSGRRLITERVQVTVYTATYAEKRPLLKAIRDACVGQRGSINGVSVDGILPDSVGPDLDDPGDPIFEQSRDLFVRWHAA
jgi:hypothetical protein